MTISIRTHKVLWGRAGNRCAMCRTELAADATETDDESLVGQECHIVADSPIGPRGDSPLTPAQRNKYANLILMCATHHKVIDDQPNTYTVERLTDMKRDHEDWVRTNLRIDRAAQLEDEVAAGYIEEWAQRLHLDDWKLWMSGMLSAGQPMIAKERLQALDDIRPWILGRLFAPRHRALHEGLFNFAVVAGDLLRMFNLYSEEVWDGQMRVEKFYKIDRWDPQTYDRLAHQYEAHVALIEDLAMELTRAGNWVCDQVRASLMRSYRIQQGALLIEGGPLPPHLHYKTYLPQYQVAERTERPYPGLDAFRDEVRFTRDYCFGRPDDYGAQEETDTEPSDAVNEPKQDAP